MAAATNKCLVRPGMQHFNTLMTNGIKTFVSQGIIARFELNTDVHRSKQLGTKQCLHRKIQMVRVRECLHDAQELKRRVRNQFLSVPFHDGAIGAYGPRTARVKVGYVSFTRNKLSERFYSFPEPFLFFLSCKRA